MPRKWPTLRGRLAHPKATERRLGPSEGLRTPQAFAELAVLTAPQIPHRQGFSAGSPDVAPPRGRKKAGL